MNPQLKQSIAAAIDGMEGWCWPEKAEALADLILESNPDLVVEIGVFGGRSLIPQALALRQNGFGTIYGIDPWKRDAALEGDVGSENAAWWAKLDLNDIHRKCMEAIWKHSLDNWCVLLRCPSQKAASLFQDIDILHLDGNHSEMASCRDVELYLPRVKRGGYIWFDDTDWDTTKKAQKMMGQWADKITSVGACVLYRKRL